MAFGSRSIFLLKRTSGQLNSKGFRRVMTQATREEQATRILKANLLNIRTCYRRKLWLLSLVHVGAKVRGDNIHCTVISNVTGLESTSSLGSERAPSSDSFPSIG